jgi:hypothetical protein
MEEMGGEDKNKSRECLISLDLVDSWLIRGDWSSREKTPKKTKGTTTVSRPNMPKGYASPTLMKAL